MVTLILTRRLELDCDLPIDCDLDFDLRIGVIDGDPDIDPVFDLRIGEFDGDLDGEFNKASY